MSRENAGLARIAWDSALAIRSDSLWTFGDSIERVSRSTSAPVPSQAASRLRPIVERAMASGRPVVLITDGEVQDSAALDGLPNGSRVIVLPREARKDAALVSMDAPRAAVEGDSVPIRVTISAGPAGAGSGSLAIQLDQQVLGRWPVDSMSAWGERQLDVKVRPQQAGGTGRAGGVLRAIVASAGDSEARNDTLATSIEVSRAASAVFVSTSPDEDARFAISVLRGALALPTRGFLHVAPGNWRQEGSLAPVTENEVRQAVRDAPVAIIHGDTAIFGPPQSTSFGPLALMVPPDVEDGEWYPSATPVSPLSGALAAIPLESLPPIAAGLPASGEWTGLEARRGREAMRRAIVTGRDTPRRVVTVTGSGFWRWRFRGGVGADAYAALWGGIFDWLAAERADRRSAVPEEGAIRAGQTLRWRRGSSSDSMPKAVLRRRGATRSDTVALKFAAGVAVTESTPLQPGIYDVSVPGGSAVIAVNNSGELLPARPKLHSGGVGRRAGVDAALGARNAGWVYALLIGLLCAEWIWRRRAGLR